MLSSLSSYLSGKNFCCSFRFLDETHSEDGLGSPEMMKETVDETMRAEEEIVLKNLDEVRKEKEKIRKKRAMLERNISETTNSVKSGDGERIQKEKKLKKKKKSDQNKNEKIKRPGDKVIKEIKRTKTMELKEWSLRFESKMDLKKWSFEKSEKNKLSSEMPSPTKPLSSSSFAASTSTSVSSTSSRIQKVILNIFIERMNCRIIHLHQILAS